MHADAVLQNLLAPVFSSLDKRNARNLVRATNACPDPAPGFAGVTNQSVVP